MRKYEYKGTTESMRTLPSEITLKDFSEITKLQNEDKGNFMYYLDTFETLGLSTDFTDVLDDKTLYMLINDFKEDFIVEKNVMTRTIDVDGYTYESYTGDEFKLNARDLASIEEKMNSNPFCWITYAMALIFKRTDLSSVEHKAEAHRKHKEKIFENITMDIALPYVMYVANGYIDNIKLLKEA